MQQRTESEKTEKVGRGSAVVWGRGWGSQSSVQIFVSDLFSWPCKLQQDKIPQPGLGNGTWTLIFPISVRGQALPQHPEQWGVPMGFVRAGHGSQDLSHHPSQEQGTWGVEMVSWAVGRLGGALEGLCRDSKACWCPQGPGSLFPSKALASELP